MSTSTVALLAFPDRPPSVVATSRLSGALAKFHKVARYRRNPRSADYMRALAQSAFPGAEIIEVDGGVPAARLAGADAIVLLWADATGYGWTPIERAVFGARPPGASVSALTGRRRNVELTGGTLLRYRVRRLVERLWLGEIAMGLALLLAAPILVAWDVARGRR